MAAIVSAILRLLGMRSFSFQNQILNVFILEPSRGKTNNVVSEQVGHKPGCTSTEKS